MGAAGLAGLAGCSTGSGGSGDSSTKRFTMGAGSDGSSTWSTGQALQQLVRENTDNLRITAQQTGGTKANLRLYSQGEIQLLGTSNYLYDLAKRDEGDYADNPIKNFPQQGFEYGVTHTYTLAREGTGIKTYKDLKGKNVWPLWSGSSIRLPYAKFLREVGLWDQMNIRDMSPSDVAGALESGRVDAIAIYGVSYKGLSGWATQVDTRVKLNLVQMSDQKKQQINQVLASGYEEIEPYGWKNQDFSSDTVTAIPMNFRIFYGNGISKDAGYSLTKLVHENGKSLSDKVTILPDLSNPKKLVQGTLDEYPVHPGAAKYFKEIGAWKDNWTVGSVE